MPKIVDHGLRVGDHLDFRPSDNVRVWLRRRSLRYCHHCCYIKPSFDFSFKSSKVCVACRPLIQERCRATSRALYARVREQVVQAYGGKCACCSEQRREFLAIDHKNGGGNKHRAMAGGYGLPFLLWLCRNGFPNECRLLCHNCNMALGIYGYCPHENPPIASQ